MTRELGSSSAVERTTRSSRLSLELRQRSRGTRLWRTVRNQPVGTLSAVFLIVLALVAAAPQLVASFDPLETHPRDSLTSPNTTYWFGTDNIGRDMFSRVAWGARTSLWVGILSVGIGTVTGTILGLISGYFPGRTDMIIQRVMDSFMAIPPLILALAIVAVLGQSVTNVMLAIAVAITPWTSRILRGAVMSVKQQVYIEAAEAMGATTLRIVLRHILPNVVAPIIVIASVTIGWAILVEASLAFLGLGAPPPTPSWGRMLSGDGRRYMEVGPWLAIFPGLAISLTVLAFNLLGDSLRDILDPRLRTR
jgi:peptide/nickel transport system permease protein